MFSADLCDRIRGILHAALICYLGLSRLVPTYVLWGRNFISRAFLIDGHLLRIQCFLQPMNKTLRLAQFFILFVT